MHLSRNPRFCGPLHLSGIAVTKYRVSLSITSIMGAFLATPAPGREGLPALPNLTMNHTAAGVSGRTVSNPASTTGREIDRLLESHTRILRSAMKPQLFRQGSKGYERGLDDYSFALGRLEARLSNLFEALLEADRLMDFEDWESK